MNSCWDSPMGMGVWRGAQAGHLGTWHRHHSCLCAFSAFKLPDSTLNLLKERGTCGTSVSLSAVGLAEGLSIAISIIFTQILGKRIHRRDRGVCPGLCGLRSCLAGVEASLGCCSDELLPRIRRYLCNSLTAWL